MAIRENNVDGTITHDVSISIRSKIKPKIRVQKLRRGLKSLRDAQSAEKELIRDTATELARREGTGVSWEEIVG